MEKMSKLLKPILFRNSAWRNHTRRHSSVIDVDIVISGGGMVGSAMACALGHNRLFEGKKIVLLEGAPAKEFHLSDKFGNRTCTLSQGTVSLFKSFGAWEEIQNLRCHPVNRMQVWDSCSESMITFNKENLIDELAFVAENDIISAALTKRMNESEVEIDVHYGTKAEQITMSSGENNNFVEVMVNDGKCFRTKLLIGADGMNSLVRKTAGFHELKYDYKQMGVVATLKLSEIENTVAWQRFLPSGPIAMLPLSNDVSNLIWTTSKDSAQHLLEMPTESFVDAVNDALWHERDKNTLAIQAGDVLSSLLQSIIPGGTSLRQLPPTVVGVEDNSRAMFPLGLLHSSQYAKSRVALIGDAAHRLHPLAGQGVNLGFGDVKCLAGLLEKAVREGSDIGSLNHLLEYETTRQRDVLPVVAVIDGLQRLYSTDLTPVVLIRSLGLQATNALTFIKDRIMQQASR